MASAVAGERERPAFLKDGMLITSHEADYMVEKLRPFDIEQVGSAEWLAQHEAIEKLNLQAHYNTMTHTNDFVMGIWMENIFPRIIKSASLSTSTVSLSLTIHREGSITNLLEVILYHQDACEAMGSDSLLELADFCCRKLLYLNTRAKNDAKFRERKADELINMSVEEEFEEKVACARFQASMCALTILSLHLLAVKAIAKKQCCFKFALQGCYFLPKRRPRHTAWIEKYNEGKWMEVSREDHFKITKSDAQVWLALYNLIMEPNCRSRYKYTDFHKDQVLKLQKYLNEPFVDQIPILKDLQWVLEEISLNVKPTEEEKNLSSLILEQVPILRERLLSERNWDHIAKTQLIMTFSNPDSSADCIQEMLRMFQFGESMEAPKCASCGAKAVQRCSRCKCEWYCGKSCQKKMWTFHKRLCDIMKGQP